MILIYTKSNQFKAEVNKSIGFVPTMGNLHKGHLVLLEKSLQENDISVLSIYVNPTQFGENEDLSSYPRTQNEDIELIKDLNKKYNKEIIIFIPESDKEIYPTALLLPTPLFYNQLEGQVRPTHFQGVITVVKNLFDIVKPTKAYFGKKDFQQYLLIKMMVHNYKMNIDIIGVEIVREESGLAMSSRNNYLTKIEKEEALELNRLLKKLKKNILSTSLVQTQSMIKELLKDKRFNYIDIRNADNFEEVKESDKNLVILANFQIRFVRLLDNVEVQLI